MTTSEPPQKTPPGEPTPRRRRPRRADAPGTGPASADGAEPRLPGGDDVEEQPQKSTPLTERERWILEQRPPHWG